MRKTLYSIRPKFPIFKSIESSDKEFLQEFTSDYLPYVDFMYSNLVSWNKKGLLSEYAILNENLVVKVQEYTSDLAGLRSVYSILGCSEIQRSVERIANDFGGLSSVPEEIVLKIKDPSKFKITEDRNNFEYIYDLNAIASLRGNALEHRRRTYRQFIKNNKSVVVNKIDLSHTLTRSSIDILNDIWMLRADPGNEENIEKQALDKYLTNIESIEHTAFGLYLKNNLKAYIIVEPFNSDYVVATFAKSDKWNYPGSSIYLLVEVAKILSELGYKFINYDVDLGLENLRLYKTLWRPLMFLKKYKIDYK